MISLLDYWQIDRDCFDGEGCLLDAQEQNTAATSVRTIVRMLVIRAAAAALRCERFSKMDGLAAASYHAALLAAEDPEARALGRCLAALQGDDGTALAAALHEAAHLSALHLAAHSARSLAELSYEAALEVGAWEHAHFAARILERLATLDECPPAAERWSVRADMQWRRVQRATRNI
jgi:hypothetical protein